MKPKHKIKYYSETACAASVYKQQQEEVEDVEGILQQPGPSSSSGGRVDE